MKKVIVFALLSLSVLTVVYWLGIEVAYLYLYRTLAISFDTGLLFFTGKWDYFLLLNGIALYFILDIFYNQFIRRSKKGKNRKRGLTRYEKNNYKHLAHLHEAKKGLTRLEFDVSGHLCNIDYAKPEILIGQIITVYILRQTIRVIHQLFLAAKSAVTAYIENGAAGTQSNMYLAVSGKTAISILLSAGLFVLCGYVFALLHQDWTQFDFRTMVDRLMKLHLRDYCDDVFDTPKQYWNKLISKLKLSDVHKMNTKQNFRIGGKQVTRRGGFPVLTYRNRVYVNAADCHSMIVATTRAGKSYSIISIMIDLLRMNGESMVINDPKGELRDTQVQKLIDDGYDVYFLDFIEPERGDCWNPLGIAIQKYREAQQKEKEDKQVYFDEYDSVLKNLNRQLENTEDESERSMIIERINEILNDAPQLDTSAAQEALQDIANIMTFDEKDTNGRFWNSQAGELIVGYANLLLEETTQDPETGEQVPLPDDLIHFKSIKQVAMAGAEAIDKRGTTLLSDYLKKYRNSTDKSVTSLAQYAVAPGPTKGSIDSVFSDKSRMMTMSESVMRMTSRSTFDLKDIARKKTAVFIIVHGDKSTYYPFVSMFIEQMYEEAMVVARENHGRMPYPVNCIFDEAGIMPSLKSIDNMVSFGASAGFRLTLAVQDTSQLERRYGSEVAHTLMNNMQNFAYLMGGDPNTLKTVSEKAGKRLIWNEDQSHYEEKAIISTERLSSLSLGEALILQLRKNPVLTRLLGYRQYCFYPDMTNGGSLIRRHLKQVPYFDLKQAAKGKNQQLEQPSKIKAGGETLTESRNVENDEQSYSGYLDLQNSTIKEERKMK